MTIRLAITYDCPDEKNDPEMDRELWDVLLRYGYEAEPIFESDSTKRVLCFVKQEALVEK